MKTIQRHRAKKAWYGENYLKKIDHKHGRVENDITLGKGLGNEHREIK